MSQAEKLLDELFNSSASLMTLDPANEPHIVIGSDRTVQIQMH